MINKKFQEKKKDRIANKLLKNENLTSNQKVQFSWLDPLSRQMYDGGPPSTISGTVKKFHRDKLCNQK